MIKPITLSGIFLLAGFNTTLQAETAGLPFGVFKTRDHLIQVSAGPDHPVYTISNMDGEVLSADLSQQELISQYPELVDFIVHGIADDASLGPKSPSATNELR